MPLVLFVITLQIYTAVVLGRCWVIAERLKPEINKQNRYPYAAIAELTFGKKMSYLVTVLLDVTVFGGGIPNLLVASQNLELLGSRITHGAFKFSFCYWLIILGCLLCPLMWLGSPKNMKVLASISVTVCSSVAVLTWLSIFDDTNLVDNTSDDLFVGGNVTSNGTMEVFTEEIVRDYVPFAGLSMDPPPAINLLKAYGIIAFQFDIHPMLLTIQVDMREKRLIGKAVCYGIMSEFSFWDVFSNQLTLPFHSHLLPLSNDNIFGSLSLRDIHYSKCPGISTPILGPLPHYPPGHPPTMFEFRCWKLCPLPAHRGSPRCLS